MDRADAYRDVGEGAWSWVRASVGRDDTGPWLASTVGGAPQLPPAPEDRTTIYFGTGGLALLLAELRLARRLDDGEAALAAAIREGIVAASSPTRYASLYFGLAGDATTLTVLGDPEGASAILRRLASLIPPGWTPTVEEDPIVPPFDVVAGLAGVAMSGVWCGGADGLALARLAGDGLLAAAEVVGDGLDWPMFPGVERRLPNFSHGTAGIAAALAVAGVALGDATLVEAARRGAAHLVSIGELTADAFTVPHYVPDAAAAPDEERVTYSWCHGPTGTSLCFAALERAGVTEVGGTATRVLRSRCLGAVLGSGVPDRQRPGFWDNDGQCCGTAGVGSVLLDAAQDAAGSDPAAAASLLAGATRMGDALVDRAIRDASGCRWRFLEHRADPSLLAPATGWSQGAAGIAAFLVRLARVVDGGLGVPVVDRPDTWWAVPGPCRTLHRSRA